MTSPIPRDRRLLTDASAALEDAVERFGLESCADTRIRLLEGAAAHIGGYAVDRFDEATGLAKEPQQLSATETTRFSLGLAEAVRESPIPPSLALASLGDSDIDPVVRRKQGRYFTDTRLALSLASGVREQAIAATSILDPACGAGVLLVAATLQATSDPMSRSHLIRDVLWGVDRDPQAVRAARASIASLTSDLEAIASLNQRLLVADSLVAGRVWWAHRASAGFDLVIANPPWEKLRVTRHELVIGNGHHRHYGDKYNKSELDDEELQSARHSTSAYREKISAEMSYQGRGGADLYKMFLELSTALTSASGALAFLLPAGFIRNSGDRNLREWLFQNFNIDIVILDNREHYFQIDSRFKFIQLLAKRHRSHEGSIRFKIASKTGEAKQTAVTTSLQELKDIHEDLTLPEVSGHYDWALLTRIACVHPRFGDPNSGWDVRFCREVDMTNDRPRFLKGFAATGGVPVIEGRMVHHHRVAAKHYVSGTGRRAKWEVQPFFQASLGPQWFIQRFDLRPKVLERIDQVRAGFCDITGQTNERTVLAALIPAGVVCGNKVPTLDLRSQTQVGAWVAIANSFVFDWLVRRRVTTTLNYFILRSQPIPAWDEADDRFLQLSNAAQSLALSERTGISGDLWEVACLRAGIEVQAASLYGITVSELDSMLRDFPQVDRIQPPIPGEAKSTVTRDLIVASGYGWATSEESKHASDRLALARSAGAMPFLPNEHARAYEKPT